MKLFTIKTFILLRIFSPLMVNAQESPQRITAEAPIVRWKIYGGIGTSMYGGELTGKTPGGILKASRTKPSFTLGTAYKIDDRFFVKAEFSLYSIKAVENDATMAKFGRTNNFEFKATNFEGAVLGQFNILPYTFAPEKRINIVPYVVLGLGFTSSNAKGLNNGHWESIQSLSNNQLKNKVLGTLPFGVGAVYRLTPQFDIGLDATVRYTLGNSLDGDSRKGISTASLSAEQNAYFDQYYNPGTRTVLPDHKKYHDLYAFMQVRVQYSLIPKKFRARNLNYSSEPKGPIRLR